VEVCCSGALEITGMTMELDEVYDEVCKDALFYKNSKGGVTLSGGEPLNQIEFVEQLLGRLKQHNIDTTVDTCGHAHWKKFEAILPYTDRFLFDLKHLNPLLHARETGIDNALILENLDKLLTREDTSVWLRIPVIGGFNDSEQHAGQITGLLNGKKVEKISLLPYHQWGIPKYKALGRVYRWSDRQTCNGKQLMVFKQIIEQGGFNVTIGF
jgi:pyruvate formate lyase activating enzyme